MTFEKVIAILKRRDQIAAIHNKGKKGRRVIECFNGHLIMEYDKYSYMRKMIEACKLIKLYRIVTTISEPLEEIIPNPYKTNREIYERFETK